MCSSQYRPGCAATTDNPNLGTHSTRANFVHITWKLGILSYLYILGLRLMEQWPSHRSECLWRGSGSALTCFLPPVAAESTHFTFLLTWNRPTSLNHKRAPKCKLALHPGARIREVILASWDPHPRMWSSCPLSCRWHAITLPLGCEQVTLLGFSSCFYGTKDFQIVTVI